jgi:hypothetical protein
MRLGSEYTRGCRCIWPLTCFFLRFVDRDTFFRFLGVSPGHVNVRARQPDLLKQPPSIFDDAVASSNTTTPVLVVLNPAHDMDGKDEQHQVEDEAAVEGGDEYEGDANEDEEEGDLGLEDDEDDDLAVVGSGDEDEDEDVYALEIEV